MSSVEDNIRKGNIRFINEGPLPGNRPLSESVNEVKEEFKNFAQTRIAMFQAETRDTVQGLKASAPMIVLGAVIGAVAFLVFTGALVAVIWTAFAGSVFGPFFAFLIVGVIYALIAGIALTFGISKIKQMGFLPKRTLRVLKEDKVWLQNEARSKR